MFLMRQDSMWQRTQGQSPAELGALHCDTLGTAGVGAGVGQEGSPEVGHARDPHSLARQGWVWAFLGERAWQPPPHSGPVLEAQSRYQSGEGTAHVMLEFRVKCETRDLLWKLSDPSCT